MDAKQEPPSGTPQAGQHDTAPAAELKDLHPFAERTLRGFAKAKPDADGRLWPMSSRTLAIQVSAENVERAIRTMDKLLKALQSAGLKFEVPQEGHGLRVNVEGEQLRIRLYEGMGKVSHVPTEEERVRIKKYPDIHGVPEWDERPSGRLNLAIDKEEFRGVRMRWVDGRGNPIEKKVDSFIEGLAEAARAKRAWRKEKEEQQRRWEEQRQKEHEAASRRWEDQRRAELLLKHVAEWNRSRLIREYIADMRANALHPEVLKVGAIPLPEWMEWALGYADRIDPVEPVRRAKRTELTGVSPKSLLDRPSDTRPVSE